MSARLTRHNQHKSSSFSRSGSKNRSGSETYLANLIHGQSYMHRACETKKIAKKMILREWTWRKVQSGLKEYARESHVSSWVHCLLPSSTYSFTLQADEQIARLASWRARERMMPKLSYLFVQLCTHSHKVHHCSNISLDRFIVSLASLTFSTTKLSARPKSWSKLGFPVRLYALSCLHAWLALSPPLVFSSVWFLFLEATRAWLETYLSNWRHVAKAWVLES